jgi:AraC-like DNA-binding protein
MILKDFSPHPSLNEFVKCYRIVHFKFKNNNEPAHKAYAPRPEVCLHFFLNERELVQLKESPRRDYRYSVVLAGQQTSVINRYLHGAEFLTFNIIFQPTAIFRLMGIPSFELTDKYLEATSIFSSRINLVLEQLQNASSYQQMILIGEQFVNGLVLKAKASTHRIDEISRMMPFFNSKISLAWLGNESGLSPKQFTRKFYERAGVNPKAYMSIIRFNKAFNIKNAYPEWDWLQIALDSGYFDYQHLAKDYKKFTGYNPNQFHLIESHSPERRFGLTPDFYKSRINPSTILDDVAFLPPVIK